MLFKTIGLANDHAGYSLKTFLKGELLNKGLKVIDFGTSSDESCDFPDFAHPLAEAVENKECEVGIVICGSGNGINMTVNKHQGIRSALCWKDEISFLARLHNDANVCSIPGRFVNNEEGLKIVNTFLTTAFEGGRHLRRIQKIPCKG